MKYIPYFLIFAIVFLCQTACDKFSLLEGEIIQPVNKTVFLNAQVTKLGFQTDASVIEDQTSPTIHINGIGSNATNSRVEVTFPNVQFYDDLGVYALVDQDLQEFRDGEWKNDSEANLQSFRTLPLDFVLALDASTSIGDDETYESVKQSAINFIDGFISQNPESTRFYVIIFSDTIAASGRFYRNSEDAADFINSFKARSSATRLYEAMDSSFNVLIQRSTVEGKAVITFTDGRNNAWRHPDYQTVDTLAAKIAGPETDGIGSFIVGIGGLDGVDRSVVSRLVRNETNFVIENTTLDTQIAFRRVTSIIPAIYELKFDRNMSNVTSLRFRFLLTLQLL